MTFNHGAEGSSPTALTNHKSKISETPSCLHCVCNAVTQPMGVMDTDAIGLIVLLIALVALFLAARWQRQR